MLTRRITRLAAVGLTFACGLVAAEGLVARQDDPVGGQEQANNRLDAIRRVGDLLGAEAGGEGGDEGIARVRDLVWDGRGRALYFLLSPGLGDAGPAFIPVPARSATLARVEDAAWLVQLDAEGDRIEAVPRVVADEVDALRDPGRRAAIDSQFATEDSPSPAEVVEEPDPVLHRATELVGRPVLGDEGPIARIEDILLGGQHQASYVILGVEDDPDRLIPVPFSALTIRRDTDGGDVTVRIEMDRGRLADAPGLEGDWHKMLNDSFVEAVLNVHAKRDDARAP